MIWLQVGIILCCSALLFACFVVMMRSLARRCIKHHVLPPVKSSCTGRESDCPLAEEIIRGTRKLGYDLTPWQEDALRRMYHHH